MRTLFLSFILIFLPVSHAVAEIETTLSVAKNPHQNGQSLYKICTTSSATAERLMKFPSGLMQAVAIAESGRWDHHQTRNSPWPWTVMAQNRGRYFTTKSEAISAVKQLLRQGITNIDVGCMQINLGYHGAAFDSLDQAFDPVHNIAYAANFLRKLKQRKESWAQAVGTYHSPNPKRALRYRQKVYRIWKTLRHKNLIQSN